MVSSNSSGHPIFGRVVLDINNSILPAEKLALSPSSTDGLTNAEEYQIRFLGCDLIQLSGKLLRLHQVTVATSCLLFQRFYYAKSFVRLESFETVAMACTFLSSKIKEDPRRIRDIINVFHHIRHVRNGKIIQPLVLDESYKVMKKKIINAERRLLKELGFCVYVRVPHQLIIAQLKCLDLSSNTPLLQLSLNYLNDSFRTDVFVRVSAETIATACIYLAARKLNLLPDILDPNFPRSPSLFDALSVKEEEIVECCNRIKDLYVIKRPDYHTLLIRLTELKKETVNGTPARSREMRRDRERRRRRDRSTSAKHAESPRRGRDRRERDTTPVYAAGIGIQPGSVGSPVSNTYPSSSTYDVKRSSNTATERGELL